MQSEAAISSGNWLVSMVCSQSQRDEGGIKLSRSDIIALSAAGTEREGQTVKQLRVGPLAGASYPHPSHHASNKECRILSAPGAGGNRRIV